jgi:hypothetical protein
MNHSNPFNLIPLLEWSGLAMSILLSIGLWCMLGGSRRARRAFRGKGYLRPPTGRAWVRFLYYKHYDSFEDPGIRFYYSMARKCFFLLTLLMVAVIIFLGAVYFLEQVTPAASPRMDSGA